MTTVRPDWLFASASVTIGESISWSFEGGREGCGETTAAVGVLGALLGCKLDENWPGVGVEGGGVVEVEEAEEASRISRAVRVSEVGVARMGVGVQWELCLGEGVFMQGNVGGDWSKCWLR